jgi:hypothetical protein
MIVVIKDKLVSLLVFILFFGCLGTSDRVNVDIQPVDEKLNFSGVYNGVQPSYFMKNKFGDAIIISGNKIEIPSIDYKFLFDKNQKVSLQQTGLDDNSRYYYEGDYKIVSQTDDVIVIECSLSTSDGTSSPTYLLEYNIDDDSFMCTDSSGGPNFIATKKL